MDEQLTELLEHLGDGQAQLTIALVDLDHFKRINDTRSHAAGDEVLRQIAGLLQDSADDVEGGLAARMGGEEFLLLLPDVGRHEGMERMDRLRRAIADHPWADVSDAIAVTASIGVAVAPEDETERGALIAVADKNLYRAKHDGRNRVAG
jgi:diguanylate cyclase (GGDEF)-like protein